MKSAYTFGVNALGNNILNAMLPGRTQTCMHYIGPGVEVISSTDVSNKIRVNGKIAVGDSNVSFPQHMAVHAKLVLARHEGETLPYTR